MTVEVKEVCHRRGGQRKKKEVCSGVVSFECAVITTLHSTLVVHVPETPF